MAIVITNIQIPNTKQTLSSRQPFNLEERTLVFARSVIRFCKSLNHTVINRELISQLVRSSASIGANYREANECATKKDFVHRIRITLREAKETQYWLQLFIEAQPDSGDPLQELLKEATELRKILAAITNKVVP